MCDSLDLAWPRGVTRVMVSAARSLARGKAVLASRRSVAARRATTSDVRLAIRRGRAVHFWALKTLEPRGLRGEETKGRSA